MLVSPAEHDRQILALGRVSSIPERWGLDVCWVHKGRRYGVQRKAVADLKASVEDGRLGKELGQIRQANIAAMVIVEGRVAFTPDDVMVDSGFGRKWSKTSWWGVLFSIQSCGVGVMGTTDTRDTAAAIRAWHDWTGKDKHTAMAQRGGASGLWGSKATDRDWGIWVLQGFPGIGPELAGRLFDAQGSVPLAWTMDEEQMGEVQGMGKRKVAALRRVLE